MNLHKLELKPIRQLKPDEPSTSLNTGVYLDGKELEGVTDIEFDPLSAEVKSINCRITTVKVTMMCQLSAELHLFKHSPETSMADWTTEELMAECRRRTDNPKPEFYMKPETELGTLVPPGPIDRICEQDVD